MLAANQLHVEFLISMHSLAKLQSSHRLLSVSSFLSLGSLFILKMPKNSSLFLLMLYSVNERATWHIKGN